MAFVISLIVEHKELQRLLHICDSVKQLFDVTLIVIHKDLKSESNTASTDRTLIQDKEAHKSSSSVGGNNGQQKSVGYNYNPNTTAQTQEQLSSVILQFESDGPPENIEKAKNFVKTHLSPNADYITCCHQLGNQEEFDMVFEHSRDIQTSTSALLTFNPDSLDVTFEGTTKSVAAARSKVVMILDQLRNPSGLEGGVCPDEDSTTGHHFFGNFLVDPIADQDNNNVTSKMTFAVINDAEKSLDSEETNSRLVTKTIPDHKPHGPPLRSKMVKDDCEDIEVDSDGVYSPPARILRKKISTSSSNTSSTDDESTSDENILTDPRYSKQIEQALKLGYAESLIRKALVKLGPNCELNDLLPELIASDSKHVDTLDSAQYVVGSKDSKRLIHSCSSGDSSSFSSSTDSPGGSFDNHRISGNSTDINDSDNLRDIIIDGSNVAMSHGKKLFSCKGIKIVVDWFRERGHKNITAFVPQWRKETSRPDAPISDQDILIDLEREGIVSFTPARRVKGKRMVCYDDRFVLNLAVDTDGIVVSNDVYRDLVNEKESFRKVVDERLLMYSFANDRFMPPEDPLGRLGPTLDNFLRKTPAEPSPKPQDCPYGKKCTYGNKCRFYHPERGFAPQKSITETLKEQAGLKLQEIATRRSELAEKGRPKQKLARTKSLVPGEPSPSLLSPTAFGEGQSRSEKPKLVHSKSQIATTKTSDYLNESRKKLEEAEMSAALEKMSMEKDAALFKKPHSHSVSYHQDYDVVSRTEETSLFHSSSPRMSPVPQKEAIKQKTTTADNTPPTNSPLKSSGSRSSRASPAHLTVPKPEPQEGYVSGHLLLAKKLSDESKEKFFSEHTSSPSSTRTTSPVMPVQSVAENKPHGTMENSPATCQGGQPVSSYAYPVAINPSLMAQHMASCYAGQDTIPNLSIFQLGAPLSTKLSDSDNIGNRHSSTDSGLVADYTSLQSPNSYSLSEPLSSPFQSHPDSPLPTIYQRQHQNYPVTGTDQLQQPLEHQNLRRSFSSTGSVAQSEDGHQKLGRRASGFAGAPVAGGHTMLKPQHSVPVSLRPGVPGMTRQNSTSDPQIHNLLGTSDMQGMFQGYGAADSAKKYQDLFSSQQYHGEPNQLQQQYQLQQQQQQQQLQRQLQLQQQYQRLHAHQQQESLMMGQPHTAKHNMGMWRDSVSHSDQSRRASLGGGSRTGQFNPHHSPLPVQASSQQPHFQSEMDTAMMTPGSFYSNPMFSSPTSHYSQQMPHSPNYNAAPRSLSPQGLVQSSHSHTGYPFHQGMIQTNPVYGQSVSDQTMSAQSMPHMKQSRNLPPSHHSSLLGILPEDAPIEPNDPRYSLYYHLSNVFGEEVVRKVMNQNRSTTDPDNLCKLIMEYKLRTGK